MSVEIGLYLSFAAPGHSQSEFDTNPNTAVQLTFHLIPIIKMGDGSSKNQLPDSMKLRGDENYIAWKEAIEDMAVADAIFTKRAEPPNTLTNSMRRPTRPS